MLLLGLLVASGLLPLPTEPQELREADALCGPEGCYAAYFQRRSFLDAWRGCRERGGNLATVKRPEEAALVQELLLGLGLAPEQGRLRLWIGLQRQPRQCPPNRPLRGFTWTTGDQDTLYTNWLRPEAPAAGACPASRCVVIGYGTAPDAQPENFRWQDGSCAVPVDGFLCRFQYKGMCPGIEAGRHGPVTYATPFHLVSTLLKHVPFGSVATVPCPGSVTDLSVLCMQREDGSVGWSKEGAWCPEEQQGQQLGGWCDESNAGCDHVCVDEEVGYYCECDEGYVLMEDGHSCSSPCESNPCEYSCMATSQGYLCDCPEGYDLDEDGRSCHDVDECAQSTCDQLCLNFAGGYECQCHLGYQLEDGLCRDTDECADTPCEHACENTPGSYTCHCHLGFSPAEDDPHHCTDTDECRIRDVCQQMCVNYVGGFECYCNEGYEVATDGIHCQPVQGEPAHVPAPTPTDSAEWASDEDATTEEDEEEGPPAPLRWMTAVAMTEEEKGEQPARFRPTTIVAMPMEEEEGSEPSARLGPTTVFTSPTEEEEGGLAFVIMKTTEQVDVTTAAELLATVGLLGSAAWVPEASAGGILSQAPFAADRVPAAGTTITTSLAPTAGQGFRASSADLDIEPPQSTFPSRDRLAPENEVSHWFRGIPAGVRPTLPLEASTHGNSIPSPEDSQQMLQRRDDRWLLVALLVPLCVFLVIMLALGIVYCTRCGAPSKRKSITDCYRWVTSAAGKTPTPKSSAKPTTCRTSV
ncbi:endosialin [Rhinatrema bivittatum]|uniref:endosialin n=1 Tax=Rhinatrema bivittatum TaxID=194408 RepID=UPI00112BB11E|nr:endosialin [Rhinatrema bivittatum]